MAVSPLAQNIANEISLLISTGELAAGRPVRTQALADRFGVSRSPVREALVLLTEQGVLEQFENRGFFVCDGAAESVVEPVSDETKPFEVGNDYQRLAEDWLTDRIPAEVTEQLLKERYSLTKAQLNDILMRAVREGWAERKQGYGWRFLPVAKTPEAFEQIYRFRMLIEPAAMLEPGFRLDRKIIEEQRAIQQRMLDTDIGKLPAERLLHNGAHFHEELIRMSSNPFFHMSLVRINRMRRLLEYRLHVDRNRTLRQCQEHLVILDLLERGEMAEASDTMRRHLDGALVQKSPVAWSWSSQAQDKG